MSEPVPSSDLRICVEAGAKDEDVAWVNQHLADHTKAAIGRFDYVPVTIFLRAESSQLRGGLLGYSIWSSMQIDSVWVDEPLRRRGYGRALLAAAEEVARIRGCRFIQLETYSELALQFYRGLGFVVFSTLRIDERLSRHYLIKLLQDSRAAPCADTGCV